MKHLKLFENIQQTFWIFCYSVKDENSQDFYLFPDKESVENHALTVINQERETLVESEGDVYDDTMYFTDAEEALNWYGENFDDISIAYKEIKLENKFEGDEKLQRMKKLKKFNI